MKSYVAHLRNKYPDAKVWSSETSIEVERNGECILKLAKNAHGGWDDVSEDYGCSEKFCLAPIPKESRVHKLSKDGKLVKDELHEERSEVSKVILRKHGKIPSMAELRGGKDLDPKYVDRDYDHDNGKYKVSKES